MATGLGDLGFPDEMIGRLLNHRGAKSKSITSKHYNHALYLRERLELLQAWERKLRGVLGLPARSEPKATNKIPVNPGPLKSLLHDVARNEIFKRICDDAAVVFPQVLTGLPVVGMLDHDAEMTEPLLGHARG